MYVLYAGLPVRITHCTESLPFKFLSRKNCPMCALVKMTPSDDTTTPLPEIGEREVLVFVLQRMLTRAERAFAFSATKSIAGGVVAWSSAGSCGFKGARKGTPFAAQMAAETAARVSLDSGMRQVEVMVSGPGAGRETAIRSIQVAGLGVSLLRDITPISHNGCRPQRRRPRRKRPRQCWRPQKRRLATQRHTGGSLHSMARSPGTLHGA